MNALIHRSAVLKAVRLAAAVAVAFVALGFCGCSENDGKFNPAPTTPASRDVLFKDVETTLRVPSQVQFSFRLTDVDNHALNLSSGKLSDPFTVLENNQAIDVTETSYFVHPAASLELDLLLLLDFTNSMASWSKDTLSALELEVAWARDIINDLAESHRMALMEYHDRNISAGLISDFVSSRSALHQALDQFLSQQVDNGSSAVWDAIYDAVLQFPADDSPDKQRTLVVLTDGRETSSIKTPQSIITLAKERRVNIFIIGTGFVSNQSQLTQITNQTQGEYYGAADIVAFQRELDQVRSDLGGHYKLSYITLRREGTYEVTIKFSQNGWNGSITRTLNLGSVFGDDRIGVLTFDTPTLNGNVLEVVLRAQHFPRNINRLRFKLDTDKPITLTPIAAAEGGLISGWTASAPDEDGFFEFSSANPIKFGDFGPLLKITVESVISTSSLEIPFEMDESIYTGGKGFTYPHLLSGSSVGN